MGGYYSCCDSLPETFFRRWQGAKTGPAATQRTLRAGIMGYGSPGSFGQVAIGNGAEDEDPVVGIPRFAVADGNLDGLAVGFRIKGAEQKLGPAQVMDGFEYGHLRGLQNPVRKRHRYGDGGYARLFIERPPLAGCRTICASWRVSTSVHRLPSNSSRILWTTYGLS